MGGFNGERWRLNANDDGIVLVIRLRVSGDAVPFHGRYFIYCDDGEERWVHGFIICASETEANIGIAKHLEPLKGGKIPLEVLVRGKDAAANEKLFTKIADVIKSSGVSHT